MVFLICRVDYLCLFIMMKHGFILDVYMEAILLQYWYIALFPLSFVEWRISTLASWFLISTGYFNFWIAFPIILLSSMSCDHLLYRIGRSAHSSKKIVKFIDNSDFLSDNIKTMNTLWKKHPIKTMLLGKNAFMISVPIVASAGIAKMSYLLFFIYDTAACFLQLFVLLTIWYYLGNWYIIATQYMQYPSIAITIFVIVLRIVYRRISKGISGNFQKKAKKV